MFKSLRFSSPPNFSAARELLRRIADTRAHGSPRVVDRPLALYGAGNLGRMAREYFERLGIHVQYVVDANPRLHRGDSFWDGVDIFGTREVAPEQRASVLLAVCVATVPYSELYAVLLAEDWLDVVPFYDIAEAYRDRHPLSNGWFTGALGAEDVNGIEETLSRWSDDVSRAHHLQFIAWHRLREDWIFDDAPVTTGNRYFIPEVVATLHDHEVFVDVGAHRGEVSARFLSVVNNRFNEIQAIEPDAVNLSRLRRNLDGIDGIEKQRIQALPVAVGDEEGDRRFFEGLGYASQFCDFGERLIEVKTLDQLEVAPTFIKLHLEGWELDALKGGLTTLAHHRPLIAATTYHNRLGLWRFPKWLMDHLPDYTFLLRLHSWCGTGSVIYAIPDERYLDVAVR